MSDALFVTLGVLGFLVRFRGDLGASSTGGGFATTEIENC